MPVSCVETHPSKCGPFQGLDNTTTGGHLREGEGRERARKECEVAVGDTRSPIINVGEVVEKEGDQTSQGMRRSLWEVWREEGESRG